MWTHRLADSLAEFRREIRLAARRLLRSPAFALAAVITLALGIGASSAIFSVVHGIVLSPLPYLEDNRLVSLWHSAPAAEIPRIGTSHGAYYHYRKLNRTFDDLAVYRLAPRTLTGVGEPTRLDTAIVTSSFLDLLLDGEPALGRKISAEDDRPGVAPVVVVSHRLWRQRFGSDPKILGRLVQIDGLSHEIVGVLPRSFDFPTPETDLWAPLQLDPEELRLGGFGGEAIGRLGPGISVEQARSDLESLIPRLSEPYPGPAFDMIVTRGRLTAHVTPLKQTLVGDVERTLWVLLGTVALVLLIACANVANLFLVRAEGRRREVAIRVALGAGRGRVLRDSLVESTLLGLLGGGFGVLLAALGVLAFKRIEAAKLPRLHEVGIDSTVLLVALLLSLLSALAFGVLPALRTGFAQTSGSLRGSDRESTPGREGHHARKLLIVTQIALALVLLVGSGLMVRSFWQLSSVEPGFSTESGLTFRISLPETDYKEDRQAVAFHQQLLDRLSVLPGVESTGAVQCLPLQDCRNVNPLYLADRPMEPGEIPPAVMIHSVTEGYFATLGIPLLSGRLIERSDHEQRTGAAVVSRSLAERFWPDDSPLGRRVYPDLPGQSPEWYTVVGVVGDVRESLIRDPSPTIYLSMLGGESVYAPPRSLAFVLRTRGQPEDLTAAVRETVWDSNPNLPVADLRSLESIVSRAEAPMALTMALLALASFVALVLGAIGIYGVLSYIVAQRRSEIGVRIALGARRSDVRRLVLRQMGLVAVTGVVVGLIGAVALTRFLTGLLFAVSPLDPATFVVVSLFLLAIALLASDVPARRAADIDPTEALRSS